MVLNEFIAYAQMIAWSQPDSGVILSERSTLILTYALCGFANFGSVGIQIGGIGGIAPERRAGVSHPRHACHDRRHPCHDDDRLRCWHFDIKKERALRRVACYCSFRVPNKKR